MIKKKHIEAYANYIQKQDTHHKKQFISAFWIFKDRFKVLDKHLAWIMASVIAENGTTLIPQEEGFRYTMQRFHSIFPNRKYSSDPHRLAEIMYAGRMGNENEGDAWKYRGRGYFQITGKDNYNLIDTVCMSKLGFRLEYAIFPELLLTPAHATISLLAFYSKRLRKAKDFKEFTHRLTGGTWDYTRRLKILETMVRIVELD